MNDTNVIIFGYNTQLSNKLANTILNYFTISEKINISQEIISFTVNQESTDNQLEEDVTVYESQEPYALRLIDLTSTEPSYKVQILDYYNNSEDKNIFACIFDTDYILSESDKISLRKIYSLCEKASLNNFFAVIDTSNLSEDEDSTYFAEYVRSEFRFIFTNKQNYFDYNKYEERVLFIDIDKTFKIFETEQVLSETSDKRELLLLLEIKKILDEEVIEYELEINEPEVEDKVEVEDEAEELIISEETEQVEEVNIVVIGEFKHGKSTLINAILGEEILPAKSTPCTAIVTKIVYGDNNEVALYEYDADENNPIYLTNEQFNNEFQFTGSDIKSLNKQGYIDRLNKFEYAQIESRNYLCEKGLRLIDSPGMGNSTAFNKVTKKFIEKSQAIIFVLNATRIINKSEQEFIKKYLEANAIGDVFFVVNKIDLVEEKEVDEIKEYVKKSLKDYFIVKRGQFDEQFYNRRVFFVNAKNALYIRKKSLDDSTFDLYDISQLEQEIQSFLSIDTKGK